MKKVLIVASVISMIEWFMKTNVDYLIKELCVELHIATNFNYLKDTNEKRTLNYIEKLKSEGVILHNFDFKRSPFSISHITNYFELKKLISDQSFSIIHTHTPVVSVITRLASRRVRKNGTKIIYTSHGFHFHRKSNLISWIIYYPLEKIMSRFTDLILTINKEDFSRLRNFKMSEGIYIPGVGVDTLSIQNKQYDDSKKRASLGFDEKDKIIVSVGELIKRKNHIAIIKAMKILKYPNLHLIICGRGPLQSKLISIAKKYNLENNVHLLGFREDVIEIYHCSDISILPSITEGLGLAGIESLATYTPVIGSDIQGIRDYIIDGVSGYLVDSQNYKMISSRIKNSLDFNLKSSISKDHINEIIKSFDLRTATKQMNDIYFKYLGENNETL
jgi:glycosyltransferase involved in cell wall biosynthesis